MSNKLAFLALVPSLVLTGCALSPTDTTQTAIQGTALQGKIYGGQQPVVGAHVYLYAANTTGYGGNGIPASTANASLSLLNASVLTNEPNNSGVDTNGAYYVTTDAAGSFSIGGDYTCTAGQQVYLYTIGGNPGAGTNSSASFMAVLGSCPAAGNFAATTPTIWVNEVSTVAAAYAMSGFASDAKHVSSSATTLAKTGIANAFAGAANLATLSTGVALAKPASNSAGTAPQTLVNSVANILTACVNSTDQDQTICNTLFSNATANSVTPTDTASAAINIVHNPVSNIATLFALQSSTPAFAPALSAAPTTFTAVLKFPTNVSYGFGTAIDATGNIWIAGAGSVPEFSPLGASLGNFAPTAAAFNDVDGIAVSTTGAIWLADFGTFSITALNADGSLQNVFTNTTNTEFYRPTSIIAASNGDVTEGNYGGSYAFSRINSSGVMQKDYPFTSLTRGYGSAYDTAGNLWAGGQSSTICKVTYAAVATCYAPTGANYNNIYGIALDTSGRVWAANLSGGTVTGITSAGALIANTTVGASPRSIITDAGNNVWASSQTAKAVYQINSSTGAIVQTIPSSASGYLAVDGAGNLWGGGLSDSYLYEFMGASVPTVTPVAANLTTPYGAYTANRP
ncbi:hypothetical protein ACFQBQ_10730 [Granulicella cerasi]|uniref:NHL repeat containing protein n=1 Tax=Granulicella cerasi TaxID=741063 RepID=A0ABW1ZBH3_9BACT|nr:hypothetical protein [Granulicella cerasi]